MFVHTLSALIALLFASMLTEAGEVKTGFIDKVYKGPEGEGKYVVYVPANYTGDKAMPTILFLHGSGETGTDGKKQVKQGLGNHILKLKSFPFIGVFPQSQQRTWAAHSQDGKRALAILEEVKKTYKVDDKRIYLTGLSMGGYGTWSFAAAHPDRWAAIVPICGGGATVVAEKIKHIPCWAFHGDADKAVPVSRGQLMIDALRKAGATPRFTVYSGVGHNSWDPAYATPELYDWLLQQKLK